MTRPPQKQYCCLSLILRVFDKVWTLPQIESWVFSTVAIFLRALFHWSDKKSTNVLVGYVWFEINLFLLWKYLFWSEKLRYISEWNFMKIYISYEYSLILLCQLSYIPHKCLSWVYTYILLFELSVSLYFTITLIY